MNNSLNFWRVNFWCVFLTFLLAYRIKAADMQSSVQKNKPKASQNTTVQKFWQRVSNRAYPGVTSNKSGSQIA